ncbi:MAG: DMT family transporter [Pseudonocardiales bacterium]
MTRRGWLLFAAMSAIWGIPYLLIKIAVGELAPATLVLGRTGLAALLLLPIALTRGAVRPVLRRWRMVLLFTAVEICVPWLALGYAEQRLSSSLTGLLIAGVPLMSAVLAVFGARGEPLGARRLVGLLTGLAGVGALVGFEVGGGDLRAVAALAAVIVAYALGALVLGRGLGDLPGVGVIAVSLTVAAVAFLPAGLVQAPRHWPSAAALTSVIVLAVVCTAVAFLVFFELVGEVGPARSTVITYVNPAVAVLLGVLILHERFGVATAVGFALILGGSVLATVRTRAAVPAGVTGATVNAVAAERSTT